MRVSSITALSPKVTPWKDGQVLTAGNWSARDFVSVLDFANVRVVSHYNTEMVEFVLDFVEEGDWWFGPLSIGWDSMTDKAGTAKLAETVGSSLRIRKGLWINTVGGNPVVWRDMHESDWDRFNSALEAYQAKM